MGGIELSQAYASLYMSNPCRCAAMREACNFRQEDQINFLIQSIRLSV